MEPVLERDWLETSRVPPVREMRPAEVKELATRSLLLAETVMVPVLERRERRVRVELPVGSTAAELAMGAVTLPKPWVMPVLVIEAAERVAVRESSWMTPALVKAWETAKGPPGRRRV